MQVARALSLGPSDPLSTTTCGPKYKQGNDLSMHQANSSDCFTPCFGTPMDSREAADQGDGIYSFPSFFLLYNLLLCVCGLVLVDFWL